MAASLTNLHLSSSNLMPMDSNVGHPSNKEVTPSPLKNGVHPGLEATRSSFHPCERIPRLTIILLVPRLRQPTSKHLQAILLLNPGLLMVLVTALTPMLNNSSLGTANLLMDTLLLHMPTIMATQGLLLAQGRLAVATPTGERTR